MKRTRSIIIALFILIIIFVFASNVFAQPPEELVDFWEMGTRYTYEISVLETEVGQSTGTFVGLAKHNTVGNKYLFRTETVVRMLSGEISSKVSSEMFTQSEGYPAFYTAEYIEKTDTTNLMGLLTPEGFQFRKMIDTTETNFTVNVSPSTVLCDRQSIPQWNLAFFNKEDAQQCLIHMTTQQGDKYEFQSVFFGELAKDAAKNGFMIFMLNAGGEILEKIEPQV